MKEKETFEEKVEDFINDNTEMYSDFSVDGALCPYCGEVLYYPNDEGALYRDGEEITLHCDDCNRDFYVYPSMNWDFEFVPKKEEVEKIIREQEDEQIED